MAKSSTPEGWFVSQAHLFSSSFQFLNMLSSLVICQQKFNTDTNAMEETEDTDWAHPQLIWHTLEKSTLWWIWFVGASMHISNFQYFLFHIYYVCNLYTPRKTVRSEGSLVSLTWMRHLRGQECPSWLLKKENKRQTCSKLSIRTCIHKVDIITYKSVSKYIVCYVGSISKNNFVYQNKFLVKLKVMPLMA